MNRLFGCLLLAVFAAAAHAEHRVALLIGNSDYPQAPLASPPRDIRAVGEALAKRGFVVTQVENVTAEKFRAAVDAFARRVPTRGTALVYFSGYALAASTDDDPNADNSLFPIDGNPHHQGSVFESQTGASRLLSRLASESGSATNILIIDGCYEHRQQAPTTPRGLVKTGKLPAESRIIYSAPIGEVIKPASEGLSPLAKKLCDELNSPKPLDQILAKLSPTQESTLDDISTPAAPPTPSIAPPTELPNGAKAGDEWVSDIGMVFCWCPPGKFTMGTVDTSRKHDADEIPTDVTFSKGFWLAKYEFSVREVITLTTRATYLSTAEHKLHPLNKLRGDDPMKWLVELNKIAPPGWMYDLPTEAEWEYAARAGTRTDYSFGNDAAELARYGNFADRTLRDSNSYGEIAKNWKPDAKPFAGDRQAGLFSYAHKTWSDGQVTMARVGSFPPNPWGLCDMHGNMSELTATAYHPERTPPEKFNDMVGWVAKGGSWLSTAEQCRSAFRGQFSFRSRENNTENYLGLRFVLRRKDAP